MRKSTWRIVLVVGVILLAGTITTVLLRSVNGVAAHFESGIRETSFSLFGGGSDSGVFYNGVPVDYKTEHTQTISFDGFDEISVDVDFADAELIESDRFELEYHYFGEVYTLKYEQSGGKLRIWDERMRSPQGNHNRFFSGSSGLVYNNVNVPGNTVLVRYPAGSTMGSVNMKGDNGNFKLTGIVARSLYLQNDFGSITVDNGARGDFVSDVVEIKMENGDAALTGVRAGKIEVYNGYGRADLTDCAASDAFSLEMDNGEAAFVRVETGAAEMKNGYGSIRLERFKTGALKVNMSNGDLRMEDVQAGTADLTNEYGDIKGSALSFAGLTAEADNGQIELAGVLKGATDIANDYGSVQLEPAGKRSDFGLLLKNEYGDIRIDGKPLKDEEGDDIGRVHENESAADTIKVKCTNGDIRLNFLS